MSQKPAILIWDIETKYTLARVWNTGKQYVSPEQIVDGQVPDVICIAWKWLGKKGVHSLNWGLKAQNSKPMIEEFTRVIESADLAIAHYGSQFDCKHLNTQRLLHKLPPVNWPSTDDSLSLFKSKFYMPSFKLDYLAKILTGTGKAPMGFQDWVNVVEKKDADALEKMERYCRRDVLKLAQVVAKALPFFKLKSPKLPCPDCGSRQTQSKGYTNKGGTKYQKRQCVDCGTHFKVKTAI